jgi:hypothetical protein
VRRARGCFTRGVRLVRARLSSSPPLGVALGLGGCSVSSTLNDDGRRDGDSAFRSSTEPGRAAVATKKKLRALAKLGGREAQEEPAAPRALAERSRASRPATSSRLDPRARAASTSGTCAGLRAPRAPALTADDPRGSATRRWAVPRARARRLSVGQSLYFTLETGDRRARGHAGARGQPRAEPSCSYYEDSTHDVDDDLAFVEEAAFLSGYFARTSRRSGVQRVCVRGHQMGFTFDLTRVLLVAATARDLAALIVDAEDRRRPFGRLVPTKDPRVFWRLRRALTTRIGQGPQAPTSLPSVAQIVGPGLERFCSMAG